MKPSKAVLEAFWRWLQEQDPIRQVVVIVPIVLGIATLVAIFIFKPLVLGH